MDKDTRAVGQGHTAAYVNQLINTLGCDLDLTKIRDMASGSKRRTTHSKPQGHTSVEPVYSQSQISGFLWASIQLLVVVFDKDSD